MNTAHSTAHTRAVEILSAVRDQYGIAFTEVGTGGGCMALEARLESGHWLVAVDEGLCGFAERITFESETNDDDDRRPMGWFVGIYPNSTEHGEDSWFGVDSIVDATDYDLFADGLGDMVGRALVELAATR
jgi:hypothetical protein